MRDGARKPSGYSFLPELEQSPAQQISIEAAQPKLDLAVLEDLPSKTIILGVIDLADLTVETPQIVAERIRRALPHVPAERLVIAPDCGMKYLPRDIAFGKMQAMVEGRPRSCATNSTRTASTPIMMRIKPPFRADHVGSLLRPRRSRRRARNARKARSQPNS